MAVEDAAVLAACLRRLTSSDPESLSHSIGMFEKLRIARVKQIHEASLRHDYTLHLPDGPEQQARDHAMEKEVAGEHFFASPNQWSDPTIQNLVYTYQPDVHVQSEWNK